MLGYSANWIISFTKFLFLIIIHLNMPLCFATWMEAFNKRQTILLVFEKNAKHQSVNSPAAVLYSFSPSICLRFVILSFKGKDKRQQIKQT